MSEAKRFCRTYRWRQDDDHVAISCTGMTPAPMMVAA